MTWTRCAVSQLRAIKKLRVEMVLQYQSKTADATWLHFEHECKGRLEKLGLQDLAAGLSASKFALYTAPGGVRSDQKELHTLRATMTSGGGWEDASSGKA